MNKYLVSFFDAVSGWLHSQYEVETDDVSKARDLALEKHGKSPAKSEDLSSHRVAITDAVTGEGIPSIATSTSEQSLRDQLAAVQRQLAELSNARTSTTQPAQQPAQPTPPPAPQNSPSEPDTSVQGGAGLPVVQPTLNVPPVISGAQPQQ